MEKNKKRKNAYQTTGDHDAALSFRISAWGFRDGGRLPLYPYAVEETVRRNRFTFSEQFCRLMIVVILLDGELTYRSGGRVFPMNPGKVLLIPPGSDYTFAQSSGEGYHKLVLEFKGMLLDSICSTLGLNEVRLIDFPGFEELAAQIREMGGWIERKDRERIPDLLGRSYALLTSLAERARERSDGGNSRVLSAAQAILNGDFEQGISVPELSVRLGVSETTLNRLFREKLGLSPLRYRNICRIEYARELLARTELSIKEIADRTGYCNQFYFSLEFRKASGCSPREFRKERQGH